MSCVWDELCDSWDEGSCVSCKMSGVVWEEFCELWDEWNCVRWVVWVVRWVVWKNLGELQWENTKAAPPNGTRKQLLSELICVRWVVRDELCEMSCVTCAMRGVVWVVRWAEWCERSSVSCEMSGIVWDELCELWDELCERAWVNFSERTRKQLHQMAHESSSWVSWFV